MARRWLWGPGSGQHGPCLPGPRGGGGGGSEGAPGGLPRLSAALSPQIRIAALNASSAVEDDDAEGTLKSHKSQTKEAQVTRPAALPPAPPPLPRRQRDLEVG